MDMAGPYMPGHPFLAATDNKLVTPSHDSSPAYAKSAKTGEACSRLRFHMDNNAWDVINQEVMDWRDSSWTSMSLPGNKTSLTLHLPSWDAQEPTGLANGDEPLRQRILAQMISVQLLASCFTPPQNMNTMTLPLDWYSEQEKTNDDWLSTRLVSSLRQHTQWKRSPAFGHQARNNSAASLWPERDDSLSREALLADQISLKRRLRQGKDRCAKERTDTKRRRQSEPSGVGPKCHCLFPSRNPRRLRTSGAASKVMRGLRLRNISDNGHRCSLEPFLRSEHHPVFVQPVKDYVVKRLGILRSGSRKQSSILASSEGTWKRPNYQRSASSTFKDFIQLNGGTQFMAMIQGSGTPLGQVAPDAEASSNASADTEQILTSAEASLYLIDQAQATAKSEPLTAVEDPSEDLPMENADYFHHPEWDPRHLLQPPVGQIRNRTSTSGTTV